MVRTVVIFDISFDEAGVPDEAHQNDSYLLLRRLVILRQTSISFIGSKGAPFRL